MKETIVMPEVKECTVTECAYNRGNSCHALAITVGGGTDHNCDTMFCRSSHVSRRDPAGVGACKAPDCIYNEDLECTASSIEVGMHVNMAECKTFSSR